MTYKGFTEFERESIQLIDQLRDAKRSAQERFRQARAELEELSEKIATLEQALDEVAPADPRYLATDVVPGLHVGIVPKRVEGGKE